MSILKEILSFEAKSSIWGIKYKYPNIALEIRNQELQEVQFLVLNEKLDIIKKISSKDSWLQTLEALSDTDLILSSFEEGETPVKKDLFFHSLKSKNKVEILEDCAIVEIKNSEIEIFNRVKNESFSRTIDTKSEITFPSHYTVESSHLKSISDFLNNTVSKSNIVSADYLELEQHLVISYFCLEEDNLNSYLLISDLDGAPIHQFETGKKLNGIAFDTFFVVNNRLYYIANTNTLSILSL